MDVIKVTEKEARDLIGRRESHFWDHKSAKSGGAPIEKIASSLANADGGEFIVGVEDKKVGSGLDRWQGFSSIEDGNFIQQSLVKGVEPPVPYSIDWLEIQDAPERGLCALVSIAKSPSVHRTSKYEVWQRNGAQDLRLTGNAITDLTLSKGTRSYEDQLLETYGAEDLIAEPELASYVGTISPSTDVESFAHKQRLVDRETKQATVAAAVLFAEVPPAVIPKKCAVKIARYETMAAEPLRDHLAGEPVTIEGPARQVIDGTVAVVTEMVESVSILEVDGTLAPARYPPEALKEIIVNAVIHRDYNVSDDILVFVFDNRVEVRSPGRLPGHVTLENILDERYSRNPTIVRLLNKYPNPPNKDIGEGLNTVFARMAEAKLSQPEIKVDDGSFVVRLKHTPLARPETIVLEYLGSNEEITNRTARKLCGIASENVMKNVFIRLNRAGKIERVPGKLGNKAAWRKVRSDRPDQQDEPDPTLFDDLTA